LKVKGDPVKVTDEAKINNAKESGKLDAGAVTWSGAAQAALAMADVKPQPDPIDKSLQSRVKAGAMTTVVPNKDKKEEVAVMKLKLVNDIPKVPEIKKDPTMQPPKEVLQR
jgi:hypothetical protein